MVNRNVERVQDSVKSAVKGVVEHPRVLSVRRKGSSPFVDASDLIVMHCCHHRVGTSWFSNVMKAVAREFHLPYVVNDQSLLPQAPAVFFNGHSRIDFNQLGTYRASHMIRDPRDMVVSGFHFHLWTEEIWANRPMSDLSETWPGVPMKQFGHLTFKEYINSVSAEEGLTAEIHRVAAVGLKDMCAWDYNNDFSYELKYEEIMVDEDRIMREIFTHYGFTPEATDTAVSVASQFSFGNRTGRAVGEVGAKSHLRSGRSGQWRSEFTDDHIALSKELYGEALITLGYENDLDWTR